MARQKTADLLFKNLPSLKKYLKYENFIMELSDIKIDKLKPTDEALERLKELRLGRRRFVKSTLQELLSDPLFKNDDETINFLRIMLIEVFLRPLNIFEYYTTDKRYEPEQKSLIMLDTFKKHITEKYNLSDKLFECVKDAIILIEQQKYKKYSNIQDFKNDDALSIPNCYLYGNTRGNLSFLFHCCNKPYNNEPTTMKTVLKVANIKIIYPQFRGNNISEIRNEFLAFIRFEHSTFFLNSHVVYNQRNKKYYISNRFYTRMTRMIKGVSTDLNLKIGTQLKRNAFKNALELDINNLLAKH
ncbi:hypothetical protein A0X03_07565 [Campylobacter fetus]|nr:hypothetical protein [Campylobacter fetus]